MYSILFFISYLIIFLGDRAALGVGADARGEEHGDLRGAFDQVPASSTRERVVEYKYEYKYKYKQEHSDLRSALD